LEASDSETLCLSVCENEKILVNVVVVTQEIATIPYTKQSCTVADYQPNQQTKTLHTSHTKHSHTRTDNENALHCSTHIPGTSVRSLHPCILGNAVNSPSDIFISSTVSGFDL
jgi:hypothetical protein